MTKHIQFLAEKELVWSAVVANNRMNRARQASGVNSYEQEIGFRPEDWLIEQLKQQGSVSWLDLCCGRGNALLQVANALEKQLLQDNMHLKGLDLVNFFAPIAPAIRCLKFETASAVDWQPDQAYDLITCIHGIHYMGDKLLVIQKMGEALAPGGLFVASFDLASVFVNGQPSPQVVKNWFKEEGIEYNARKKLIRATGQEKKRTSFAGQYLGANDQAGKNYTGQEAVTSYYSL